MPSHSFRETVLHGTFMSLIYCFDLHINMFRRADVVKKYMRISYRGQRLVGIVDRSLV